MINPFKRTYTKSELEYFTFLTCNKLFEELNKKELLLFLPFLYLRKYTKNEVIFFRNDPSQALYLIKNGEITFKLDIGERFEPIATVDAPAVIGNSALINKAKRVYTAIVTSNESEVYVLPQVNIFNVFDRRPTIKAKMLESLSEIYHQDFSTLFTTYQSTQGFFDLNHVFDDFKYGC
jgi:CRP-like cAMP-binding protein